MAKCYGQNLMSVAWGVKRFYNFYENKYLQIQSKYAYNVVNVSRLIDQIKQCLPQSQLRKKLLHDESAFWQIIACIMLACCMA